MPDPPRDFHVWLGTPFTESVGRVHACDAQAKTVSRTERDDLLHLSIWLW